MIEDILKQIVTDPGAWFDLEFADKLEVVRLAHLGLWAEKIAIPAFKTPAEELACSCCDSASNVAEHFEQALATLPKTELKRMEKK